MFAFATQDTASPSGTVAKLPISDKLPQNVFAEQDAEIRKLLATYQQKKESDVHVVRVKDHSYLTYKAFLQHLYTGNPIFYAKLKSLGLDDEDGLRDDRPSPRAMYRVAQ